MGTLGLGKCLAILTDSIQSLAVVMHCHLPLCMPGHGDMPLRLSAGPWPHKPEREEAIREGGGGGIPDRHPFGCTYMAQMSLDRF